VSADAKKIDWRMVRALSRAFVVMSVRTMPIRTMRGERKGSGAGSIAVVLVMFTMFGGFMSIMIPLLKDPFAVSFMLHTMTLILIGTSAMSEASEVLFSSSENDVLLHRPIQPATLVLSKAITIVAFTLMLAGALNFFPTLTLAYVGPRHVLAPLAHIVSIVTSTVFASAAVICLYGLVARLLGRARLQRVVTAAQIGSTLFLAVGFQLIPRLLRPDNGLDLPKLLQSSWFTWLLPPSWFAAFDTWIGAASTDPRMMELGIFGLAITLVCAWLGVVRLPTTGSNAAVIQEEARDEIVVTAVDGKRGIVERLVAPWLRDPVERASFALAKAYLFRDRNVKVRLAAALGMFLVMPLIGAFDARRASFMPMMFFWMTAMVPMTVVESLRISSNPAAADLFLYAPIPRGASVFHGVRKAAILFVQAPMALYILAVAAWTTRAEPQHLLLLVPALFVFPSVSLIPGLIDSYLPLSIAARTGQRSVQGLLILAAMIPAGLIGWVAVWAQKAGWLWPMVIAEAVIMSLVYTGLSGLVAHRATGAGQQLDLDTARMTLSRKLGSKFGRRSSPER
jgi:hypothetical protein